jgi:hypothetical protein
VAQATGARLADVVATVVEMTGAINVFAAGGPLSRQSGRCVRNAARDHLRERYGFDVIKDVSDETGLSHKLARLLRFPEPSSSDPMDEQSGMIGAARAVCEIIQPSLAHAAPPRVPIPVRTASGLRSPSISAFSVMELGTSAPAHVLFPGRRHLPPKSLGYVRSRQRAAVAAGLGRAIQSIPGRDYREEVLTLVTTLVPLPYSGPHVVLSARNTVNEWRYQVRIGGEWFRRHGDLPIPPGWPVVALGSGGAALQVLSEVDDSVVDLVSGLPLVTNGQPISHPVLVSNCSDVAHAYDVDPQGRRGSSPSAWSALSDLWQQCKDENLSDEELTARMDRLAASRRVRPSEHLLHSVIAQRWDGSLVAFAITGGLKSIARVLSARWNVRHAVLLDNGGSVGWLALMPGADSPAVLVAGANYRPRGTAFLVFDIGGFLHPLAHDALHGAKEVR